MRQDPQRITPQRIFIEDLPALEGEAALFDAGFDPSELSDGNDQVIISLILNP